MDYLEGMLLHSWWSDTDYASRKHRGTWFFYSFVMSVILLAAFALINLRGSLSIIDNYSFYMTSLITLFLVTPILCMVYYKTPIIIRLPILALLGFKYISLFAVMIANAARTLVIPADMTINTILNWGNDTVGDFLTEYTLRLGVSGLFVGSFIIALLAVIAALIVIVVLVFAPMLILYIFNLCQYLWDTVFVLVINWARKLYENYRENNVTNSSDSRTTKEKSNIIDEKETIR